MEEAKPEGGPTPMKRGRGLWIGIAIVVVVVAILLAAVLGGFFAPPATPHLRIGTLLSITGGLKLFGPGDTLGAQLAVEEINKAGGVLGQPIELFVEDDQTSPTASAAAATKLISQNRVNAIVGAQFSGGSLAIVRNAGDNGVVMVSPSATSVLLSDLSVTRGWFFRTISSDRLQGAVAAKYLHDNVSFSYANVMVINNPYGTGLGAIFKTKFEAAGGTVNTTVTIPEAQSDYTSALTTLFSTNPQVIYFVAYPDTGLTVMKQWEQQRGAQAGAWDRQWVFSEGLQEQVFINQLRDPAVNVDVTKLWGTAPAPPVSAAYAEFVAKYKARWSNYDPVLYASHTYDAVYLVALAAQKAGSFSGAAIRDQLRAVSNPPGTAITGNWTKALAELKAGNDVNWEGYSGSQDLNATNDPNVGSYEIWGVGPGPDFRIKRNAFFGEGSYQPVSPPPALSPSASLNEGRTSPSGFVGKVQAVVSLRRT